MVNESNFEVRSDLWVFFEVTMASEATKIASTRGEINGVICSPPKCPLSEGSLAITLELPHSLLLQLSS